MIATATRTWIKPPIVYEATRPKNQSTIKIVATVHSMADSALGTERVTELGPGSLEGGLDRAPAVLAGALQELEPVKRLVVLRLSGPEESLAFYAARRDGPVRARRQRRKL
jgi:hypothetical protein